jgi:signal transduction histidine kinase
MRGGGQGPTYARIVRLPQDVRRWVRAHPTALDGVVAAALTVANLLSLSVRSYGGITFRDPDLLGVLVNVAAAAPLVVRRRFPAIVAAVVAAAYLTAGFLDYSMFSGSFAALLALYTLGAHAPMVPGLLLTLATASGVVGYLFAKREVLAAVGLQVNAWTVGVELLVYIGIWLIGRTVRARREYLAELEHRAERLERTASAELRAALAEERARMARELHDVVAHHVSVMTVQAAAARRMIERAPERSVEAMRAVEETGRAALVEMRRIVGALRNADAEESPSAELPPQAGVKELDTLIDRAREAGLDVDLTIVGEPRELPSSIDLAIYRVVQESLTNTLRHAGPTRAAVVLRYEPDAVEVSVTDDGSRKRGGTPRPADPERVGHGLIGMRERVTLNGGTLYTGPRSVGGFEVKARLPLEEART